MIYVEIEWNVGNFGQAIAAPAVPLLMSLMTECMYTHELLCTYNGNFFKNNVV